MSHYTMLCKYGKQTRDFGGAFIFINCISKQPQQWSCWYTLDQYSDLIDFTNAMKNIEAETDAT